MWITYPSFVWPAGLYIMFNQHIKSLKKGYLGFFLLISFNPQHHIYPFWCVGIAFLKSISGKKMTEIGNYEKMFLSLYLVSAQYCYLFSKQIFPSGNLNIISSLVERITAELSCKTDVGRYFYLHQE